MFGLDDPKLKAQVTLQSASRTHSCFLGRFLLDGTQQTSANGDRVTEACPLHCDYYTNTVRVKQELCVRAFRGM